MTKPKIDYLDRYNDLPKEVYLELLRLNEDNQILYLVKVLTGNVYQETTIKPPFKVLKNSKQFIKKYKNNLVDLSYNSSGALRSFCFINEKFSFKYRDAIVLSSNEEFLERACIYNPTIASAEDMPNLLEFINNNFNEYNNNRVSEINLLTYDRHYDLDVYEIEDRSDLDIKLNYNNDFIKIDERIKEIATSSDNSMMILHGEPGTGKTTYIRHLISYLVKNNKEVVYLPPNITSVMANPDFTKCLDMFKNKTVIIEDAEGVLMDSGVRSQAVSNILNMTDGLLADIFKINFIFTFNSDIKYIDSAILRKGRLDLKYEFKPLEDNKLKALCKKLNVEVPESGRLCDVYNSEENILNSTKKQSIGFKI